jgi:hypothetical protein
MALHPDGVLALCIQTNIIINDLKKEVNAARKHALEKLQNVHGILITKNADLEELLKNCDEVSTEITTKGKKILSKISIKATPNLSDMQLNMTAFNNARFLDDVIFRECVEKLSEKFDKMADSMANAGSKHEASILASIKCFSTKNNEQTVKQMEQISPRGFKHSIMFVVKKTLFVFNILLFFFVLISLIPLIH